MGSSSPMTGRRTTRGSGPVEPLCGASEVAYVVFRSSDGYFVSQDGKNNPQFKWKVRASGSGGDGGDGGADQTTFHFVSSPFAHPNQIKFLTPSNTYLAKAKGAFGYLRTTRNTSNPRTVFTIKYIPRTAYVAFRSSDGYFVTQDGKSNPQFRWKRAGDWERYDVREVMEVPAIRGANLGSWLMTEPWMNRDVFKFAGYGDGTRFTLRSVVTGKYVTAPGGGGTIMRCNDSITTKDTYLHLTTVENASPNTRRISVQWLQYWAVRSNSKYVSVQSTKPEGAASNFELFIFNTPLNASTEQSGSSVRMVLRAPNGFFLRANPDGSLTADLQHSLTNDAIWTSAAAFDLTVWSLHTDPRFWQPPFSKSNSFLSPHFPLDLSLSPPLPLPVVAGGGRFSGGFYSRCSSTNPLRASHPPFSPLSPSPPLPTLPPLPLTPPSPHSPPLPRPPPPPPPPPPRSQLWRVEGDFQAAHTAGAAAPTLYLWRVEGDFQAAHTAGAAAPTLYENIRRNFMTEADWAKNARTGDQHDWAFEMGRKYGVRIWFSVHVAPGSQAGKGNARDGLIRWRGANINRTLDFVTWLSDRYGADPVWLGMGLLNEPVVPGANGYAGVDLEDMRGYGTDPMWLGMGLLNEPVVPGANGYAGVDLEDMRGYYSAAFNAIRAHCLCCFVAMEGRVGSNFGDVMWHMSDAWHNNVILEQHIYEVFGNFFSSKGVDWEIEYAHTTRKENIIAFQQVGCP
ncbi:unnamed protein product [Closterium sp. NIES-64]|nr:unnamed protein product [Closterium sp. NIES-64]